MRKLIVSLLAGGIALGLYFIIFGEFSPAVWVAVPFAIVIGALLDSVFRSDSRMSK